MFTKQYWDHNVLGIAIKDIESFWILKTHIMLHAVQNFKHILSCSRGAPFSP